MSFNEKINIPSLVAQMKTINNLNELDKLKIVEPAYEPETSIFNNGSAVLIGLCEKACQRKDNASYNNIRN
jgi:hypothetical protein